jgi:hypothetical protein
MWQPVVVVHPSANAVTVMSTCAFGIVWVWWFVRYVRRRTPTGILRRLQTPGARLHLGRGVAWNPAQRLGAPLGPGSGTYWMDDAGLVHLTWHPKNGAEQDLVGEVPPSLRPGSPQRRKVQAIQRGLLIVYLVASLVGFAIGYLLSSGSTGVRLGFGAFGIFAGWVLIWFLTLVGLVGWGTRSALNREQKSPPSSG